MIRRAKRSWELFKRSKPGHRFQDRYRRRQRKEGGRLSLRKIVYLTGGTALAVASAFLGWLPGPGWVTFFLGLALVAGEFRPAARVLDWAEVGARRAVRWGRRVWRGSSPAARITLCILAALAILALAYGAYLLVFAS